jgi:hypothetical protein
MATAGGGYRLRSTHQLWNEITQLNEYKAEFLAGWRKLGLDLCIAPCFACPAPLSKDVGRLVRKFRLNLTFGRPTFDLLLFLFFISCIFLCLSVQLPRFASGNSPRHKGERGRSAQT